MYKFIKIIICIAVLLFPLQNAVHAKSQVNSLSKPTEGVESSDPNYGSSRDVSMMSTQSLSFLLSDWYCAISNTGSELVIDGSSTAIYPIEMHKLTLYLQKWNGSSWVDIAGWTFYEYNSLSISKMSEYPFQRGNYYRTRSIHYGEDGTQTETQYATSSYIYVS